MPNNPGTNTYQSLRDQNRVTVASGQSNADSTQSLPFLIDHITGRLLVSSTGGGSSTFVYNEIVSGSGTSWTLSQTPLAGAQQVYGEGQLLTPSNDYSITGTAITTVNSFPAGSLTSTYQTS